jgi:prepilin-type N-terminal cleavage/methylation domain-containing protein
MTVRKLRAFTLIELLIVITIIGILAVALVPRITGGPAKARDATRKADLQQIATALEFYADDTGSYPAGDQCVSAIGLGDYLTTVPGDPNPASGSATDTACSGDDIGDYAYYVADGGYILMAHLENANDASDNVFEGDLDLDEFAVTDTDSASANLTTNAGILCSVVADPGCIDPVYVVGR